MPCVNSSLSLCMAILLPSGEIFMPETNRLFVYNSRFLSEPSL